MNQCIIYLGRFDYRRQFKRRQRISPSFGPRTKGLDVLLTA
jgi:hypothetical protein